MRNLILAGALLLTGLFANAQWEEIAQTDDFGDPTGKTRTVLQLNGKFSNTATREDNALMLVEKTDGGVGFILADYGGATNRYYKETFVVLIKKANDSLITDFIKVEEGSWLTVVNMKYPNMSKKEANTRLRAFYEKYGGLLKSDNWSKEVSDEWHELYKASNGQKLSPLYNGLRNLEAGDRISVKGDSSKYLFTVE